MFVLAIARPRWQPARSPNQARSCRTPPFSVPSLLARPSGSRSESLRSNISTSPRCCPRSPAPKPLRAPHSPALPGAAPGSHGLCARHLVRILASKATMPRTSSTENGRQQSAGESGFCWGLRPQAAPPHCHRLKRPLHQTHTHPSTCRSLPSTPVRHTSPPASVPAPGSAADEGADVAGVFSGDWDGRSW